MTGVFISYRRQDAAADAGRLHDDLRRRFAAVDIFMDLEAIPAGRDFRAVLAEKLESCAVLLVLIGPRWLDVKNETTGQRRLDEEEDYVRFEIATGLVKGKLVMPVLLPGATMPKAENLPKDIRELAFRNAFELRYDHWGFYVSELVKQLPPDFECTQEDTPTKPTWRNWAHILLLPISLLTATHVFSVVTFQFDPQFLLIGIAFLLGFVHDKRFHFDMMERVLAGLANAFLTGVLTSIIVPLIFQQDIIPRSWEEVRLFATFVAGIFAGYLAGTLLLSMYFLRGKAPRKSYVDP